MKQASIIFLILWFLACGFFLRREGRGQLPQNPVSVMTFNVGTVDSSPTDMDVVKKVILKSGVPDVIFLQEVPGEEKARKLAKSLQLANCIFVPYGFGKNGLSIISRFPQRKVKTFDFGGNAAVAAEAEFAGRKFLLCSVHLARVRKVRATQSGVNIGTLSALRLYGREIMSETPRSRSVEKLLTWLSTQAYRNIIIGGDFNTIPFSKAVRRMGTKFKDALWPSFQYFTGSYNISSLPVSPRIDYIFYSPGIKCLAASIVKESAGDHYPIKAVFDL